MKRLFLSAAFAVIGLSLGAPSLPAFASSDAAASICKKRKKKHHGKKKKASAAEKNPTPNL
jgi:hypothetical protein